VTIHFAPQAEADFAAIIGYLAEVVASTDENGVATKDRAASSNAQ